ncbi:MAG: GNAT family N-acetyltransferase [Cyclobacteriaceae bacterium]
MKFKYGDSWERFPIEPGEVWGTNNGSYVAVNDLFSGLPDFMYDADMVFIDPPWNAGNMNTFYTKAELEYPHKKYIEFIDKVFEHIVRMIARVTYIEIGKQNVEIVEKKMQGIYTHVERFESTYYKKHPCFVVRGSLDDKSPYDYNGVDEAEIIKIACEKEIYNCVGDFCMGRGLVGRAAYRNKKRFVGAELNKRRLAVLLDNLYKDGAQIFKYMNDGKGGIAPIPANPKAPEPEVDFAIEDAKEVELEDLMKKAKNEGVFIHKVDSEARYFKAVKNNEVVGFARVFFPHKDRARLSNLYVLPEYRKRGIGKALIDYRMSRLRHCKSIDVYTYKPEEYFKLGFKQLKKYDSKNGETYHLKLKQNTNGE